MGLGLLGAMGNLGSLAGGGRESNGQGQGE